MEINHFCISMTPTKMQKLQCFIAGLFIVLSSPVFSQTVLECTGVEAKLYLGKGTNQPLVVGLGGSEGGNAWASGYWKKTRDEFIEKGYAFLAIGYFGAKGTPPLLERISIENVYNAIELASQNKAVNKNKIAIVGGSRGADLALLLGSYYKNITCVAGIVASNVVFPGNTRHFTSSSWTYEGKELPFVPVNEEAVPFILNRNLRGAFETMLKDTAAAEKSVIKVEHINGPILLLSATEDEICPSTPMSEKIITRLKTNNFKHYFEHKAITGGHAEPLKHFDLIFKFLETNFLMRDNPVK